MKNFIFSLTLLCAFAGAAGAQSLDKLADKLSAGLKDRPAIKLAVLEFPYAGGKVSEGPVVVQERLITALAQNKKITLIERGLLKKVMEELNLQSSGAMDEATVKKLGKMLGADAIVTGTLNDLKESKTEINARVVETDTAKILAAASLPVKKTWKDTAAGTGTGTGTAVTPVDFGSKPLVQVAVLLDTSGSMDGLINQARTQLWKIVNELVSSEKSGSRPVIEVALYEYGNSGLAPQTGWMRQVMPFTTDLDAVAKELFSLRTNGGDEFCGQAIKTAVDDLKWSPKSDVYKAIFIAGNEPFTQGPVPFQDAIAKAKAKNIFVNTIYCGARQQGLAEQWKAGADLAEGDYTNIDQGAVAYQIAAPQDDKIAQLSAQLNNTYVSYGSSGELKMANKAASEAVARGAGKSVYAERAAFQAAAAPAQAAAEADWDAVSALESGKMKKEDIKADQLPPEVQKLDKEAREKYLDGKLAERKKIKDEINALQAQRKAYIAAEEKKQASGANTLDKAMIESIRSQATKRGYKFRK
ncbi:MAG: FlgO family outer membrane protein [Elusimicrobiales bacterium]|nr:FlgO family outer membrane protein [Elusimicrobiales bacterium]